MPRASGLDTYAGLFDSHIDDVAERMNSRAMAARAHYLPTGAGAVGVLDERRTAV